jgi:anti-sigma B factor antagonist
MPEDTCPVLWTGHLAVVTLPRDIDSSNAGQVGDQLLWVINRGAAVLVADMTGTVSCDYSGADALARAYRRAVASGTQLRLVVTARAVRRVLALNGLDHLAAVYPDLDGALAAEADRNKVPGERKDGIAREGTQGDEQLDSAVTNIFTAAMMLRATIDLPHDVTARRITEALSRLDDAVRQVRAHEFAEHGRGSQPSGPGLTWRPPPLALERSESATDRSALLRQHVAQTARALQFTSADTAALLEQRADVLRQQPTRIDYPAEIKRWQVFADQAGLMAERWE